MVDKPTGGDQEKERSVEISHAQGVQIGSDNRQIVYVTQIAGGWVERPPRITADGEFKSPYKGLNAFGEDDAAFFSGRDQATGEILARLSDRLNTHVPLVVSGASGAGKSSLLGGGVLPRLASAGLPGLPGTRLWQRVVLTPAREPLAELASATAPLTGTDAAALRRSLVAGPRGFADIAHSIADGTPDGSGRLVLVIDQFEQVFTQCADDRARDGFISALHAAASVGHGTAQAPAALVILVVRADFEARCAEYEELMEAVQSRYLVTPMTERQLRVAITRPAQVADAAVAPGLVDELVRAARGSQAGGGRPASGVLPHVSHALDQAWRHRAEDDVLSLDDYERAGGIEGSIKASANRAFESLTAAQQSAAQQVFLRLVTVSSDLAVSAGRATRAELAAGGPSASDVDAVVEAFAAERLLTVNQDSVEISHEVLLTAWERLSGWLDGDRIDLASYSRLTADANDWDARGRPAAYLYRPGRLAEMDAAADRLAANPGRLLALGRVSRAYLEGARHAARWARRRRSGTITVLSIATAAALTAAVVAWSYAGDANQQSANANQQSKVADSRALAGQSLTVEQSDPMAADQLAVAAWRDSQTTQAASAMTSLLAQQEHAGELLSSEPNDETNIALSPDGTLLATENQNSHYLRVWNTVSGRPVSAPLPIGPRSSDVGGDIAFSLDGDRLASVDNQGHLRLWNPATGALMRAFPAADALTYISFSPDGRTLVGTDNNGVIYELNVATGERVGPALQTGESGVTAMALSPDGELVAESDLSTVGLWNLRTGRPVVRPWQLGPDANPTSVAFSPDGRLLATGDSDGYVRLWNTATGKPVGKPLLAVSQADAPGGGYVAEVAFSPSGNVLASADSDDYVKLWNPATGHELASLREASPNSSSSGTVLGVVATFSAKTGLLASADANGTVQLWNTSDGQPVGTPLNTSDNPVQVSPQASLLTADADGYLRGITQPLSGNSWTANAIGVQSLEGNVLATPGPRTVLVVSRSGTRRVPAATSAIAVSPDGGLLATLDTTRGRIQLWETATGTRTGRPMSVDDDVFSMAFSPDGTLLAVGYADGTIQLWNTATGSRIHTRYRTNAGHGNDVNTAAFSPDGKLLATATADSGTILWDPSTGRRIATLNPGRFVGIGGAQTLAFSPDGTLLAVGYADGTIQLWNPAAKTRVGGPLPTVTASSGTGSPISGLTFTPDGSLLLSVDSNSNVDPWEVWQYTNPYAALCDDAGPPTADVWRQYAAGIPEPSGICRGVPAAAALHG